MVWEARPAAQREQVERVIEQVQQTDVGGLLVGLATKDDRHVDLSCAEQSQRFVSMHVHQLGGEPGMRCVQVADRMRDQRGHHDPKPASRTRPAFRPTRLATSAPAASRRPTISRSALPAAPRPR